MSKAARDFAELETSTRTRTGLPFRSVVFNAMKWCMTDGNNDFVRPDIELDERKVNVQPDVTDSFRYEALCDN